MNLGFGELTPEDIAYRSKWRPATDSAKGWRVHKSIPPSEHYSKSGRIIRFKTMQAAQRRADELNLLFPQTTEITVDTIRSHE